MSLAGWFVHPAFDLCKRRSFVVISLIVIHFRKAAAGFDHAHHEEDHQQDVADSLCVGRMPPLILDKYFFAIIEIY